ncbi:hypothetical protein [Mesorhizobium sp. SP-1A]|uniref:hypothetical protein n=1 Tax=Mesorhizobium sp. SP-1A TaxID=3077840 RepID=UPI0028F6FCCB|nr:hypothetical protein [Mesorhizobium sp. SP-1A]
MSGSPAIKHRRIYQIEAKPRTLKVAWGRDDIYNSPSIVYAFGGHGARSSDAHLLMSIFEDKLRYTNLVSILEERGYDKTTLKFSVALKPEGEAPATNRKRYSLKKAKPGELRVYWGYPPEDRHTKQLCYVWGGAGAARPDARVVSNAFEEWDVNNPGRERLENEWSRLGYGREQIQRMLGPKEPSETLLEALIQRGYDMDTLHFSIRQKDAA